MSGSLPRLAVAALAAALVAGCSSSGGSSSGSGAGSTGGAAGTGASSTTGGNGAGSTGTGSTGASASTGTDSGSSGGTGSPYTFATDVAPILTAHCITCHQEGGIAPYPLRTYADAFQHRDDLGMVVDRAMADAMDLDPMPPWPPGPGCNSYQHERTLTAAEQDVLSTWALSPDAPEGTPTGLVLEIPDAGPMLAHVDTTVSMPGDYLPELSPDDYHCFIVPWTETTTKYVTGLTVRPGNAKIVHHVIAFIAGPADLSKYTALETDGGAGGYTCFGGAGADDSAAWLGAWAPGSAGGDFPAGTGVKIEPGSAVILQVHYNVLNGPGETDRTQVDLELADSVTKEAAVLPFLGFNWYGGNMPIAAGDPDAGAFYSVDPTPYMDYVTNGVIPSNTDFQIYGVGAHMHLRGRHQNLNIARAGGTNTCLLDVPDWDFHWQGMYTLQQPETFHPGDQLQIGCNWDNSQDGQPYYPDGGQPAPTNLNWGEGTNDEMCLGLLYLTR